MSSPSRRIGWVCSSGPSGSRERRRRSDWRTSSTISNACSSCGASRRHIDNLRSPGALNIAKTAPVVHLRQNPARKPIEAAQPRSMVALIEASRFMVFLSEYGSKLKEHKNVDVFLTHVLREFIKDKKFDYKGKKSLF